VKTLSTDRGCHLSKPGPKGAQVDYSIQGERGLRLRVSANRFGHVIKSWSLLYRRKSDDKRCRVHLGSYPEMSLAEARTEARKRLGEVVSGSDPAATVRLAKEAATFAEMADQWLEQYAKQRRKSWRENERMLKHDILPRLGALKVDDITKREVSATIGAIVARGAGIQANRCLSLTRTIYAWGVRNGYANGNPALIDKPVQEEEGERTLSIAEIKTLWTSLDAFATNEELDPILIDILRLCLLLGQRVNEIAQAPKTEFDLDAAIWTMTAERTKNSRAHRLPIPGRALGILQNAFARTPKSEFAFKSPARLADLTLTDKAVSHAWRRVRVSIGLSDVTVHDLRRTFGSLAGDAGFDDFHVGLVLNHRSGRSKVTSIYNRSTYDAPKRAVLEAVERAILKAIAIA
jgi:integrase